MKNFTFVWVAALTASLCSCFADNDDVPEVLSEWKLVAVMDSHDAADFTPTDKLETISFLPHSRVSRTPYWCGEDGEMTVDYSEEGYIYIYCREDETDALFFEIEEEIMVITDPSCTEGCKTKYERIR